MKATIRPARLFAAMSLLAGQKELVKRHLSQLSKSEPKIVPFIIRRHKQLGGILQVRHDSIHQVNLRNFSAYNLEADYAQYCENQFVKSYFRRRI